MGRIPWRAQTGAVESPEPPPEEGSFLLLINGTDFLLLVDGESKLELVS